jgi:hypothetical protein
MAQGSFSATVNAWTRKSRKRMLVVFQQSTQDVIKVMQTPVAKGGNMPVDTGFLRSSLQTAVNTAPAGQTNKPIGDGKYTISETQYTLTINGSKLGDTIYAVYLAKYAAAQEYGTKFMSGHGFVRLAAMQWQSIVRDNVGKAQNIS